MNGACPCPELPAFPPVPCRRVRKRMRRPSIIGTATHRQRRGSNCRIEADPCPAENLQRNVSHSTIRQIRVTCHARSADPGISPPNSPVADTLPVRHCAIPVVTPCDRVSDMRRTLAIWMPGCASRRRQCREPAFGPNPCELPRGFTGKLPPSGELVFTPAQRIVSKRRANHVF